ncbi:MAG: stage II sporulation protein P [Oscillospiraceae bacterium]|nr:stage II sporulation protein P [Oscillospiraceae bacterium]
MYPILYRKKTRTGFLLALLLLALGIRLLGAPEARRSVWKQTKSVLGSETLLKTVVYLETGMRPEPKTPHSGNSAPDGRKPEGLPAVALRSELRAKQEPVPTSETEAFAAEGQSEEIKTEIETETGASAAPEPISFTAEEAEEIDFRGDCSYTVDKAALLQQPLNWPDEPGPKVLVIHSHSCESYTECEGHSYTPSADYRTLDMQNNVVAVGDALAEALAALGVELIHDRTYNDYPDYNSSYAVAREKIEAYLEQNPSIVMVLDLHRDALEQPVRESVELDGQTVAPLMLVVGTDEGGLDHPHWADNLSCALKLQALANRAFPALFKQISFRSQRFNGDLTRGSLIVEVGSTENTLPEAIAAMPYLAQLVAELLQCP